MQELTILLKKHTDGVLEMMGFEGESIIVIDGKTFLVNVEVDTPALLIGRGGEGLEALQHVVRLLASEALQGQDYDVVVDIAGYRQKKASYLTRTARDKAYQVLATGLPESFPPMSAYERRIVHMTCADIDEVETTSEGTGRDRKVVIKPKKG